MAARELQLLLTPEGDGPITLDQKQRRELLRRLERTEKLEAEVERLRRQNEDLQRERQELRKKLGLSQRELAHLQHVVAALAVATPPSKKVDRPSMPAPAEPRAHGRRPGGQPDTLRMDGGAPTMSMIPSTSPSTSARTAEEARRSLRHLRAVRH